MERRLKAHWANGAPAGDPPEGVDYILDHDGLIVGMLGPRVALSPDGFAQQFPDNSAVLRRLNANAAEDLWMRAYTKAKLAGASDEHAREAADARLEEARRDV